MSAPKAEEFDVLFRVFIEKKHNPQDCRWEIVFARDTFGAKREAQELWPDYEVTAAERISP